MKPTGVQLRAAGGAQLAVKGEIEVECLIESVSLRVKFIVANIMEEVIIGSDFLTENKVKLDFERLCMDLGGEEIPVVKMCKRGMKRLGCVRLVRGKSVENKGILECKINGDGLAFPGTF